MTNFFYISFFNPLIFSNSIKFLLFLIIEILDAKGKKLFCLIIWFIKNTRF